MDETIKSLLVERLFLDIAPEDIDTDTPLSEYGVDSFLLFELLVALEEAFDVRFDRSDIKPGVLKSVASITALVKSKMN